MILINRKNTRSQFIRVPKELLTEPLYRTLGSDGILLYSLILDRAQLSKHNELFIDEHGKVFVYFTIDEICRTFGCGREKACGLVREAEHLGLIKTVHQAYGKPQKIYPLEPAQAIRKTEPEKSENPNLRSRNIEILTVGKSDSNKTYNNKTYFIQSDSIGEGYGENAESQPGAYGGFGKNTVLERIKKAEQEERQKQFDFGKSSILERAKKLSQEQDNR